MFITTKLTVSMLTGEILAHEGYEYSGPVALCKGDDTVKSQENAQLAFNNTLKNAFSTNFANQSGILGLLNTKLAAQLNNPQGFTPAQMATLNTANTENAAKDFAQAQTASNEAQAARGGSSLPSGVSAQLAAENAKTGAAERASGSNAIQLANANAQEQSYWNAVSGLNGVANAENPSGFASLYNQGSGTVGNLGTEFNQTQQSQLLSALSGAAGAGLSIAGKALASGG